MAQVLIVFYVFDGMQKNGVGSGRGSAHDVVSYPWAALCTKKKYAVYAYK